jgi:outer membrane protein assembly factor BamB
MKNPMMVMLAGCVMALGANCIQAQDWPQWRGPNRDNKLTAFAAPTSWPKELTQKWKITVGLGESSPVLVGDKLYVFARQGSDEVTMCLDAASGKELWKDKYAADAVKGPASPHPGPRSTPAVGEGKVCTLGVAGTVSCLDAANGTVVWRKETKAKPGFYTSSSPMIVDGKCIVYVGALTAYNLADGAAKWTWKGSGTPYGSPVLLTIDGTKQIVTPTQGALAGIAMTDGKLLWEIKIGPGGKDYQSNFGTPVIDGQTVIYSANPKGKGAATVAVKIEKKGDGFSATELWQKSLAAHQYHTPVLHDGLLFGVSTGLNFFCMDAHTGEPLWTDTGTQVGKCGAILDAGPVLLALSSDKDLIAMRQSKKAYEEVARYRVADAETWAVPIIAGNRIYVKDKGGSLTLWTIQ